jgi:hypothetical protein
LPSPTKEEADDGMITRASTGAVVPSTSDFVVQSVYSPSAPWCR